MPVADLVDFTSLAARLRRSDSRAVGGLFAEFDALPPRDSA